ncbi:MAG: hypothetical protein IPJ76_03520 [Flavobacteriales bacterium]|nr:MAG: hypothetical protein IPJ76_03520 [Flavobacteriales bacterium]
MATWDISLNDPSTGSAYIAVVVKPNNTMRVGSSATANTVIPPDLFDIHYVSGIGPGSTANEDPWVLGPVRGTSNRTRNVEIRVFLDGKKKKKITATIMDSSGGGPRVRR